MNIKNSIQQLVESLPIISKNRNYWLVRTQSGSYYDSFYKYNYIALGYDKIPYSQIQKTKDKYPLENEFFNALREIVIRAYPEEERPGLIASQISKFFYEIKKGDIVIIPSQSSKKISFGIVTQTFLKEVSESDIDRTGCPYIFRKSIRWEKAVLRDELDPYLFKIFQAHQAINNINDYSELIERNLNNFFVKDQEAHLVLEVETQKEIHAKYLFNLGSTYLNFLDEVAKKYNLDISSEDIEVKITLNSPGRLHFKAPKWSSVVTFGLVILAVNGGGLEYKDFKLSTSGIIKSLTDFYNQQHDRQIQDSIIQQQKNSLKVKDPDDLVKLLQQVSTNKNNPK